LGRAAHAFVFLMFLFPSTARAAGDPMGHEDRARSLYRVVVSLDGAGHPVLPLAVLEHQKVITIDAPRGIRILGTGDGAVEMRIPAGKGVTVSAREGRPGNKRYYVGLVRAPSGDMATLVAARKVWTDRKLVVKPLAIGTTYALAGRVLDTRQTVLVLDPPYEDLASAEARAAALAGEHGSDVFVHSVVAEPPTATLNAVGPGGVEVRADDVLWFEALSDDAGETPALLVSAGGRRFELPGRVYVAPGDGGGLVVVNEARIETILEGVVASEIFPSAPSEALRAQAVAARTDMLAKVGLRHYSDPFSICSEVHCQAYAGTGKVNPKIAAAVQDTRGVVLVGTDGRLVDTFYSASTGGHSENNENAWRMAAHPNLRGRPDLQPGAVNPLADGPTEAAVKALLDGPDRSWGAASGRNKAALRWEISRSAAELASTLRTVGVDVGVVEMNVIARGVSGRIIHLELVLVGGAKRRIWGELRIRRMLRNLRSSLMIITPGPRGADGAPKSWMFRGAGYGHGVGMDQTGAIGRAAKGQKHIEILGHYYHGASAKKLY
jgi:stage II sporulation protein D